MTENKENKIDLIVQVIDSAISIRVTRQRSTDVVRNSIVFQANAHLRNQLGAGAQALIRSSGLVRFEPAVGPETRFCDFKAEDKAITVYALADLDTPSLMAHVRALEAEKENLRPGATQYSSKPLHNPTSTPTYNSSSSSAPQPPNGDMFDMIRTLQLRLEEAEAQRKKDAEKVEAQRKKDAERVEAQRKKDAERVEAQRKKDAERVEAQRKTDAERVEVQRKKDQADAKAQTHKLMTNIQELEYKIKRLEQQATERELEWKQNDEATQRYIESLAGDIEATTDFLAVGDEAGLDRIKRRNLLDRAQALLATHLGLVGGHYSASMRFREALGSSSSPEERQQRLSDILREKTDELPVEAALLTTNPAALKLLGERFSKVRLDGDQVAHGHRQRSWYEGAVTRSVDKIALMVLLDLVLPVL